MTSMVDWVYRIKHQLVTCLASALDTYIVFITGLAGALLFLVFSRASASSLKSDSLGAGKPSEFCHGF